MKRLLGLLLLAHSFFLSAEAIAQGLPAPRTGRMNEVQNFLFGPPIAGQYKGLSQTMLKGLRARAFHILHREPLALLACILLLPLPSAIPSPGGLESSTGLKCRPHGRCSTLTRTASPAS